MRCTLTTKRDFRTDNNRTCGNYHRRVETCVVEMMQNFIMRTDVCVVRCE